MTSYYPIFLKLKDRETVVIGGGEVAARKVSALLECGASVTVISPELTHAIRTLADKGHIRVIERNYQDGDMNGAYLAIVATDDPKVNHEASQEARKKGVLVNVADDTEKCDFIAPSVIKRGDLTIAVSTGGLSPAMARRVREELEDLFPPEYADLLKVMGEVRKELRSSGLRLQSDRWQEGIDGELKALVRRGELKAAKERLLAFLTEGKVAVEE